MKRASIPLTMVGTFCLLVILCFGLVYVPPMLWQWFGPHTITNELVGRTEVQIIRSYGTPYSDRPGYEPLGLWMPKEVPSGPIRTVVYFPRGLLHPERGTLQVWYVQQGNKWVCIRSCWYDDKIEF